MIEGHAGGPSGALEAGLNVRRPWRRRSGEAARKTVTFGDSTVIRSSPLWAFISFVLLIGLWYVATKAWGFPEDVREAYEAGARESGDRISDANMIRACDLDKEGCGKDAYTQWINPRTFPSVRDTWNGFFNLLDIGYRNVSLWEHTWASLWRVIRGMFWGVIIGVPIGFAMALSTRLRGFFDTPVELFRPIPPLALVPLFVLWFGLGDGSAVRMLIFASVWIMIIAARSGAQAVSLSKVRAAYSLGANRRQVLMRVILPNALPELFTGIRVALGVSWGTLVAAEFLGTSVGLGAMILAARNFFRLDVIVNGIIIIAVLGVFMDVVLRLLESVLIPWRGKG